MKKSLFAAALLLGSILLVGCDPEKGKVTPGGDSAVTAISINPKEATLNLGGSIRLNADLTPADAQATVTWSSSNENIATVTEKGFVFASEDNYGECYIYASVGDLKDSCLIKVMSAVSSVIFNSAIVWDEDTTYYIDKETGRPIIREIETSDGEKYNAYIAQATLYVFSDGFYINNSGYFDGATEGVILKLEAPMFYAAKDINPGSEYNIVFCLGEWVVNDTVTGYYLRQCTSGSVNETAYISQMKGFVEAFNADPEDAGYATFLKGAGEEVLNPTLNTYTYDTDESGEGGYYSSYIPEAICKSADLYLNNDFAASNYMCGMDYSEVVFQTLAVDTVFGFNWGLNLGVDAAGENIIFNDEKVHYDAETRTVYGEKPAEAPKRAKAVRVRVISEEPKVAALIREQIENHKNVISLKK